MIGTILGGRYEILEKIGMGGMAIVYKARCRLLNRYVAVKVLRSEYKEDQEFIRRFNIESQAAASLSHQNIVSIYDVGQQEDIHYIVMELVEGQTLKEYIAQKGALYWKEALSISMQICSALQHAHSKHIIHRDIKPQNIIITKDHIIKVMDFGIARAINSSTTTFTTAAMGSAHYISPEQARGGYTDQRSDIYSLGVVMYEMFTGVLPFDGDSPIAVAMQHLEKKPVAPTLINKDIPKSVEKIIMKAMSKEQRLRYESAEQMLADIKKVYVDPESEIKVEDADAFTTRKIDVEEIKNREIEKPEVMENRKTIKKKNPDTTARVLAVILSLVIVVILGIFFANSLTKGGQTVETPKILNMTVEEAEEELKDSQFSILITQEINDDTVPKGRIISQSPKPGEKVKTPKEIEVVVSLGEKVFEVADYTGKDYREVVYDVENSDLSINCEVIEEESETIPSGIVIRQFPQEGATLKKGGKVILYVSKGKDEEPVLVPYLIGMTLDKAKEELEKFSLVLGQTSYQESDKPKNTVISQSHSPNESVEPRTVIDLVLSDGKQQTEPVNTPTPTPGATKQYTLDILLPRDREKVALKVTDEEGEILYEKTHNTSEGTVSLKIRGSGNKKVRIYFDNTLVDTKEIKF